MTYTDETYTTLARVALDAIDLQLAAGSDEVALPRDAAALVACALHDLPDLLDMRTRIQQVLLLNTGQNRRLYGLDFEAGMVKALCIVHSILNPGSSIDDVFSRITDAERPPNTQGGVR